MHSVQSEMNPSTNLPVEVSELIFEKLNPTDLLQAAMVGSVWKNQINSSQRCLKKLRLRLKCRNGLTDQQKQELMNGRQYQNVEISDATGSLDFVSEYMSSRGRWKSVEINRMMFKDSRDCVEFFRIFENTVETLKIDQMVIMKLVKVDMEINFAKLKFLSIKRTNEPALEIFNRCTSLEKLVLEIFHEQAYFTWFLSRQRNLRKLDLSSVCYKIIFSSDARILQNRIEEITVRPNNSTIDVLDNSEHFRNYLRTQVGTLRKLHLGQWPGDEILKLLPQMTALRGLQLSFYAPSSIVWDTMFPEIFQLVEVLDVCITGDKMKQAIEAVIKAAPKVKYLRINYMDKQIAKVIAENMGQLQVVDLFYPNQNAFKEILPLVSWGNIEKFISM